VAKCIKLIEQQLDDERKKSSKLAHELQAANQLEISRVPLNQENLVQELNQQCCDLIEQAKQLKQGLEAQIKEKDEIIQEHVKEFRRLSDQCQNAEQENFECTERITEVTEIMDKMVKRVAELEKTKSTVNPMLMNIRDAAGAVFNKASSKTPTKNKNTPTMTGKVSTLLYNISSGGEDSDASDNNGTPIFAAAPTQAAIGTELATAMDSLYMQKNTKVPKAPKRKLNANNIPRWINDMGQNCANASPLTDYFEIAWTQEILEAKSVGELLHVGGSRYEKRDQLVCETVRPLLSHRQLQEIEKVNDECCRMHERPLRGRMMIYLLVKSLQLDSTDDWTHAWQVV